MFIKKKKEKSDQDFSNTDFGLILFPEIPIKCGGFDSVAVLAKLVKGVGNTGRGVVLSILQLLLF